MARRWIILVALTLATMLSGCGSAERQSAQQPASGNAEASSSQSIEAAPTVPNTLPDPDSITAAVTIGYNNMGFNLLRTLIRTSPDNIFISPLSAAVALSMTYNGARGQTAVEFGSVLGASQLSLEQVNSANLKLASLLNYEDSSLILASANAIWMRNDMAFKQPFLDRVQASYQARLTRADFTNPATRDEINSWVTNETKGRIENLVEDIPDSAVMYLINALYFKGTWSKKFDSANTRLDTFTLLTGAPKSVQMMNQLSKFPYFADSQVQIIKLPYLSSPNRGFTQDRLHMYVLLPDSTQNYAEFVQSLSMERWQVWDRSVTEQDGTIMLPRFTLEYKQELNEPLKALGLRLAFSAWEADFRDMWEQARGDDVARITGADSNVFVSKVLQKTFVAVDEVGTEAAAATSVEMGVVATAVIEKPEPFVMVVDRPFVCAIVDDLTGAILFIGAIVEPMDNSSAAGQ